MTDKEKRLHANSLVNQAVKRGELKQLPCEYLDCGDLKTQAHHPDYDEPLTVIWLCREHHYGLHTSMKISAKN